MLTKIIKKVKFFFGIKKANNINDYSAFAEIDKTTILLGGLNIRFDNGKERRKYIEIGEKGLIRSQFIFESKSGFVRIGKNVHRGGAMFISRDSIIVEDDVTMAWGIVVYDHNSHSVDWEFRKNDNHQCYEDYVNHNGNNLVNKNWDNVISKPIRICSKVWIGFDVAILKGVTIGEGSVIGAKSVVTKDVDPWTIVAGNPAKVVKKIKQN